MIRPKLEEARQRVESAQRALDEAIELRRVDRILDVATGLVGEHGLFLYRDSGGVECSAFGTLTDIASEGYMIAADSNSEPLVIPIQDLEVIHADSGAWIGWTK